MSATDTDGADKRPETQRSPQQWFVTPNRNLSVARLHIALGIYYVAYTVLDPLWSAAIHRATNNAASGEGLPVWTLLVGMIVLIVGGIALVLEARVERTPSAALWPAPPKEEKEDTPTHREWLDIAVLQLALGVVLIPQLGLTAPAAVPGWRIVAITAVSELVYLAFLGARLIQKQELVEVLHEIDEIESPAAIAKDSSKPEEEHLAQQAKLRALEARATVLMRQFGWVFVAAGRKGGSKSFMNATHSTRARRSTQKRPDAEPA